MRRAATGPRRRSNIQKERASKLPYSQAKFVSPGSLQQGSSKNRDTETTINRADVTKLFGTAAASSERNRKEAEIGRVISIADSPLDPVPKGIG
ncbi:hypothetical protein MTO96_007587 [Rhipicephalus appendiculatus]